MLQEDEKIKGKLELSCAEFNVVLDEGTMSSGQFTITADNYCFGEIYSSDTRVRNIQRHFESNSTIDVEINGTCLKKGEEIKGHFCIISNEGEYTLPFTVKVLAPVLMSSQGEIVNLFHFINLAKSDWAEAVEIFYNPYFKNIFAKKDQQLLTLYRGLSHTTGNENNVEEFLIAVGKKLPIDYQLDTDGVILENLFSSEHEYIHVKKSNWGYTDLNVEKTGDFFTISHSHIGNDDFQNNICTLDVFLDAGKLKPGANLGRIHVFNSKVSLSIPVRITMEAKKKNASVVKAESLEFQMLILDEYMNTSEATVDIKEQLVQVKKHVEEWINDDDEAILPQLYKSQILLLEERFNEAKWFLDEIGHRLRKEEVDISTKCYYYYLTTLYNRDEEYIHDVINAFENALYKNKKQWRIALLLLYIDEEYTRNPDKKWNFLKEQYDNGCTSPLIYDEAFKLLMAEPTRLMKLESFEQQVIWYGIKKKKLSRDLREHVIYIAGKTNTFSVVLYEILQEIYDTQPSEIALNALCRLLIMNCKNDKAYFKWYKLAIDKGIRLTGLYEYYMYTLDTSKPFVIPKMLLLYFSYQSQLEKDKKAVLYRYVIEHAEEEPEIAEAYVTQIERFVLDEIRESRISEDLAFLYENVIVSQMLRDDTTVFFTPLLFMHEISVENDNITAVVLVQDRMKGESVYPVENHKCQLPVYTEDYTIFLQDEAGNRYTNSISFDNRQMVYQEELIPLISDKLEGRISFDFYQIEREKAIVTITKQNVEGIRRLIDSEIVVDSIKSDLRTKLLHFYYDDDRIGDLDYYLDEVDDEDLDEAERAEFMRFLITRGKFDKAYIWLKKYGAQGVNQKNIARLVSKRIQSCEYMEDDFLINVAFYVFKRAKYDEATLLYLIKYYKGKIRDLRDIWFAATDLKLPTKDIEERMLRQMLITGEIVVNKNDILLSYEEADEHNEALVEQYYENIATDYFLRNVLVENEVLEKLYEKHKIRELSDIQKLAFLKYLSECKETGLVVEADIIEKMLLDFYSQNKYFAFFRKLSGYSSKLHFMRDRFYIEYHTENDCDKVLIHLIHGESVRLEDEESEGHYRTDEMQKMYDGIYVKECTLFAGEILQYYISEVTEHKDVITYSNSIKCEPEEFTTDKGRFSKLNDIAVSMELMDSKAMNDMLGDYLYQDYFARDLFRTI